MCRSTGWGIVRTLMRSTHVWMFAGAGVLAGLTAWLLGPPATLPLLAGIGAGSALLFAQWMRIRQRWIGDELTKLSAAASQLAGAMMTRSEFMRWEQGLGNELAGLRKQLSSLESRATVARHQQAAQLQALQNLYAIVPVRHRMPSLGAGWAVSPDLMLLLVSLVQEHRPATIVELGSGASTVWIAMALQEHGVDSRIVSVDHDAAFAASTRERLTALGLDKLVELRHAPLVELELAGESYPWYDRAAFADVESCDLLVVDGPPGNVRPGSRYPALPVLADRMPSGSHVVLDDYQRPDERQMVARWVEQLPGWRVQELTYEKGAALLTRTT